MSETCENCRFWRGRKCHRFPPNEAWAGYYSGPYQGQKPDRYELMVRSPETSPVDWCGEWKAKP